MPRPLIALLLAAGLLLSATAVPGVFTIDENGYLVTVLGLRRGSVSVPGTGDLPASRALLAFDPTGSLRSVSRTPVASSAPPLYAFAALPFAALGWRGLVLLNTLAFLGTVVVVFAYARRHAAHPHTPWTAAAAFGLGGYALEYAQGVWPHMLAVLLCSSSLLLASRVREGGSPAFALAAGVLGGLAAGVRYQNVAFAGCVGIGLVLVAHRPDPARRVRSGRLGRRPVAGALFALGAALPLLASATLNHARLGSWNPISKGPGYVSKVVAGGASARSPGTRVLEAAHVLFAKGVDFSAHPPFPDHVTADADLWREPISGATVLFGAVKKAWLQSSPWLLVSLVALLAVWLARGRRPDSTDGGGADAGQAPLGPRPSALRELRAGSLIVLPMLLLFGWAGFERHDGVAFNQRYFHELVPIAAVALAWALERRRLSSVAALSGALAAAGAVAVVLGPLARTPLAYLALMKLPLLLALALALAWIARDRGRARTVLRSALVGLCIGWGLAVHVGDDLAASRRVRAGHGRQARAVDAVLPERAALFAWGGMTIAFGPLQLGRDLVLIDPALDGGESAPRLVDALLRARRRVFVLSHGFPRPLLDAMARDHAVVAQARVDPGEPLVPLFLIEIGRTDVPEPGAPREARARARSRTRPRSGARRAAAGG